MVASTYGYIGSFLRALKESLLYDEKSAQGDNQSATKKPSVFAALVGDEDGAGKVKGIGPTAISALLAFSKEKVLMKAAKDLANVLTIHDDVDSRSSSGIGKKESMSGEASPGHPSSSLPFKDMTIVFTGTIPGMSRTKAQNAVKKLGARATPNTVSKETTLVVEGEDGGKKSMKARELGVRVIDYAEFMKLIDEPT